MSILDTYSAAIIMKILIFGEAFVMLGGKGVHRDGFWLTQEMEIEQQDRGLHSVFTQPGS